MAFGLAVYASQDGLPRHHARLASGRWSGATGRAFHPQGSNERFQSCFLTSLPPFPSLAWRNVIYSFLRETCHQTTPVTHPFLAASRHAPRGLTGTGLAQAQGCSPRGWSIIRLVSILDHKSRSQPRNLRCQPRQLDRTEHFVKVFVGGRRFIDRVSSTICQNIGLLE